MGNLAYQWAGGPAARHIRHLKAANEDHLRMRSQRSCRACTRELRFEFLSAIEPAAIVVCSSLKRIGKHSRLLASDGHAAAGCGIVSGDRSGKWIGQELESLD